MGEMLYASSSEMHGLSVLNARAMVAEAVEFTAADDNGQIRLEQVSSLWDYEVVSELSGFTIFPKYKVVHEVDGQPGRFNGMFICEEFGGSPHPLLLVPAEKVSKIKR